MELSKSLQLRHGQVLVNNSSENYNKLYQHWHTIPAVKTLDNVEKWIYDDKKIRVNILRLLSKGFKEPNFDLYSDFGVNGSIRRSLNPKEIIHILNNFYNMDVKLPNLYFHLEVLEDYQLIEPVCVLTDGRYDLSYFGRTAKLFLFRTSNNEFDQVLTDFNELNRNLQKFIELLELGYSSDEITSVLSEFIERRQKYEKKILGLFEDKGQDMFELEIDPSLLFVLLTHIFVTPNLNNLREDIVAKS